MLAADSPEAPLEEGPDYRRFLVVDDELARCDVGFVAERNAARRSEPPFAQTGVCIEESLPE